MLQVDEQRRGLRTGPFLPDAHRVVWLRVTPSMSASAPLPPTASASHRVRSGASGSSPGSTRRCGLAGFAVSLAGARFVARAVFASPVVAATFFERLPAVLAGVTPT